MANKLIIHNEEKSDYLSNLPDPILHHIFSYLDVNYVIQTSILSNRYRSLWHSLHTLNFNSNTYLHYATRNYRYSFMDFVHNVLVLRNSSSNTNIDTIRVCYSLGNDTWINAALGRNIRVLEITFKCMYSYCHLHEGLVTCKSLEVLKLDVQLGFMYDRPNRETVVAVGNPRVIDLPKLKVLRIESFCFRGTEFVERFISGCPKLDRLSIINCAIHERKIEAEYAELSISSKQLKYLEIDRLLGCDGFCGMYARGDDEEYQYVMKKCRISVSAPMLVSLKCRGYASDAYLVEDLSSLVMADIDMEIQQEDNYVRDDRDMKELGINLLELFRSLSGAKSLTMSACTLEIISHAIGVVPTSFDALRYLKLKTLLSRDNVKAIQYVLENSFSLETLVVEITKAEYEYESTVVYEHRNVEFVFESNFDNLKVVEMRNVQGSETEVVFLKALLKSTSSPEKVTIFTCKDSSSPESMKEFMKFRLSSLRGLPSFELSVF